MLWAVSAFDQIVLTAANEMQARGYRAQLRWRQIHGLLPAATTVTVVADPGGRRVGSLGATLHVLALLAETLPPDATAANRDSLAARFAGHRILICHSGGDSRRTPAYAAQGKVFTPVPSPARDGHAPALFDLILANLEKL